MPSSLARDPTAPELRPVSSPVGTPLCESIFSPWPSKPWNALTSTPIGPYQSWPSVSTPSTSNSMSRMRRARSSASGAMYCMPSLDDFGAERVGRFEGTDQLSTFVNHEQLIDFVFLHDVHSFRRQCFPAHGSRFQRHDFID